MEQEDAKDAIRISIWDYGGQSVFYTLHHLFLTRFGVYLVVFNLTELLERPDESSNYLLFWLNSIKLHAPSAPVLLVGTFLDLLIDEMKGSEQMIASRLQMMSKMMNDLCVGFDQVCSFENYMFCPISNKDKTGISSLRKAIERETESADYVQTPVSLKWMHSLDILTESSNKQAWVKVAELKVELNTVGVESGEELEAMLKLFHELGVVLYFSSSMRLKEVVISKPEWLLQKLGLVIRDKNVHDYDTEKIEQVQLTQDLERFLKDGIISRDLLDFFWDGSQVDYLLDLMRHLLLLSNWKFSNEEEYLVPSMLSVIQDVPMATGSQFNLEFVFLPQGVFERMCCLCVGYSSSLTKTALPKLFKSGCQVDLGEKGFVNARTNGSNTISVSLSQAQEASTVLDFFLSMLHRIQNDFMHGGLKWQVLVGSGAGFVSYEEAKANKLEPWIGNKKTNDDLAIDKFLEL